MNVLLTGGAGFIGTACVVALAEAGHRTVVLDNLANSSRDAIERCRDLIDIPLVFAELDVRSASGVQSVIEEHGIDAVIHLAGMKSVSESVERPVAYYDNNVGGTIALLNAMEATGVRNLVFSSSCTVYAPGPERFHEGSALGPTNPYGRTKLIVEEMIHDLCRADPRWNALNLRYFNPIGAHPSGRIGEDPRGIPSNLVPFVSQVAVGQRELVTVYGADYPTRDGTAERDYIHVMDLAEGHVAALRALPGAGCLTVNLGTGRPHSVLEVITEYERACGRPIPRRIGPRRPGDVAVSCADASLAQRLLGWQATRTLAEMCRDAWNWQSRNPLGYTPTNPVHEPGS